jgi:Fe(3+) dicitrate transport protein
MTFYIKFSIFFISILCCTHITNAQVTTLKGRVLSSEKTVIEDILVVIKSTDKFSEGDVAGNFEFKDLPYGKYTLVFFANEHQTIEREIILDKPIVEIDFTLEKANSIELKEVVVREEQEKALGILRLRSVQNFTVYEGKKNEIILLQNLAANTSTNNARQIYGTVTGLNIWESDGAGLQLGIGGRGLSPNRTSNFNTRQNGYDISADALGYPESYYTPPTEAIDKIEVIRGAAGLQYGTQFGGMVNFQFKKGSKELPFEYNGRQTLGSWNFINSFNSIGGTSRNKKITYYSFYQRKQGDGWRPNSEFNVNTGYMQVNFQAGIKTSVGLEYSHMDYLSKQGGGLTDALFKKDARQSVRNRNWFGVNWDLLALTLTHKFTPTTQLNIRNFGLLAQRQSLGNLERINVVDFNQKRTLIKGQFKNVGSEIRLLHRYKIGKLSNVLLTGVRLYAGRTTALQGDGDSLANANFTYLNPNNVEGSDYVFPNYNYAFFAEHIFNLSSKLSITPGIRLENIQTYSNGYYRQRVFDFAGNIIADKRTEEELNRKRSFAIAGLGLSYKVKPEVELYGNISQNYRAINFTDLRIQNPNFVIDSNLTDEKGYTADLGIRGSALNIFNYEVTAFYLYYQNRIGQILKADQPPLFLDYRLRTNVAASRNVGIESFASINIARLSKSFSERTDFTLFINTSVLNAKYIKSKDASIQNKEVEMVPPIIFRSGATYKKEKWKLGFQINYTAQHYSDATNAVMTSTAVEGLIPSYTVSDLTGSYQLNDWLSFEFSCNNLFNEKYFTRRAESYPGPGIIPSDGRSIFMTIGIRLAKKGRGE